MVKENKGDMMGRPTKYKVKMCKQVIELMKIGASKVEVCAELGISKDTFFRWKKEIPEFSDSVERGELLSEAWWTKHGRENLYTKSFNQRLFFMCMKNMHGWSEKTKIETTEKKSTPICETQLNQILETAMDKVLAGK